MRVLTITDWPKAVRRAIFETIFDYFPKFARTRLPPNGEYHFYKFRKNEGPESPVKTLS